MFNISKAYVKLLSNALGCEYPNLDVCSEENSGFGEYLDIKLVYEWLSEITIDSENPDIGLKVLHNTNPAMLGVLGYAIMSCETLGDALERLIHYHSLISNSSFLKLHLDSEILRIEGFEVGYKAPRVFIDSGASVLLGIIQWLVPCKPIKPLAAEFVYPQPDSLDCLKDTFGNQIKFSSGVNSLTFDRGIYSYRLMTASSKLNNLHTDILKAELRNSVNGSVSTLVKGFILDELLSGNISSLKSVSRLMNVSSRSLQYALSNEALTFTIVFSEVRKELAHHLIRNTNSSFKYVCATLGFCDKSSFHKSSLRWFGMTPQQYREKR